MCLYVTSSVLWCPLRFPHKNDVRFVFTPQLFEVGLMSYLRYLCLFAYSGVQHIFWCVFVLFVFVLCTLMLPVSLDCPFLIAPSVFSNVYLQRIHAINSRMRRCQMLKSSDNHRFAILKRQDKNQATNKSKTKSKELMIGKREYPQHVIYLILIWGPFYNWGTKSQ